MKKKIGIVGGGRFGMTSRRASRPRASMRSSSTATGVVQSSRTPPYVPSMATAARPTCSGKRVRRLRHGGRGDLLVLGVQTLASSAARIWDSAYRQGLLGPPGPRAVKSGRHRRYPPRPRLPPRQTHHNNAPSTSSRLKSYSVGGTAGSQGARRQDANRGNVRQACGDRAGVRRATANGKGPRETIITTGAEKTRKRPAHRLRRTRT